MREEANYKKLIKFLREIAEYSELGCRNCSKCIASADAIETLFFQYNALLDYFKEYKTNHSNEPITYEQILEMDGKVVWVQDAGALSGYSMVQVVEKNWKGTIPIPTKKYVFLIKPDGFRFGSGLIYNSGGTSHIYKYKPEDVKRGLV